MTSEEKPRRYEVRMTDATWHLVEQKEDVFTFIGKARKGHWIKDIHGMYLNPRHILAVRIAS